MKIAKGKIATVSGSLGLVVLATIASPYALADDSGWYVGVSAGQSRAKIDDVRIVNNLLASGFTGVSVIDNNRDTGYKLFGGYKFNKNLSLEGGYFDLGKFSYAATTAPPGTLNTNIKINGLNFDAVGTIPLTEKFSISGRIGVNYANTRDSFIGTGAVGVLIPNPSKREANPKVGLGLQYDFTRSVGMRFDAERYRINDAIGNRGDIDLYSIGLVYRFGEKAPAQVLAPVYKVAAPEPVVHTPAPAPKPVAVMPRPVHKTTFSADSSVDSLFGFGKASIRPKGQQKIDQFAADLKGAQFEVITVTGHADRIGSKKFNQKLSERRADAVRYYLIGSTGIPPGKIEAKGVGESQPVTKPGDCSEKMGTELIACLAPDRRVEVEVDATRTYK